MISKKKKKEKTNISKDVNLSCPTDFDCFDTTEKKTYTGRTGP